MPVVFAPHGPIPNQPIDGQMLADLLAHTPYDWFGAFAVLLVVSFIAGNNWYRLLRAQRRTSRKGVAVEALGWSIVSLVLLYSLFVIAPRHGYLKNPLIVFSGYLILLAAMMMLRSIVNPLPSRTKNNT